MKPHRHRSMNSVDYPFAGPVKQPENTAAHGNICQVDNCRCGAVRRTNINQGFVERGPWIEPE